MRFQVAEALAHFLWQGFAIAAILFILLHLLRSASARYNACAGALALMCISPVATFFYLAQQTTLIGGERGIVLDTALASPGSAPAGWLEANATRLCWLWLSGALFLLIRTAMSWWRARRVVTRGFEPLAERLETPARRLAAQLGAKGVQFRVSARVASALVFGWLKPIIVLPAAALGRLTEAEIEALLAHELAHVVRRDFLANLLQTVAECVLFYHPLVWWVSARMREERELCCDDFAVAVCRDEVLYSKALLRLEELRMEPALAATGGRLSRRIRRLLDGPETSRIAVAPALAFVLVFGVSVALLAQNAPPAPPEPPPAPAAVELVAPPPPAAGAAESTTVYRAGGAVSMPRPVHKVEPEYTKDAHAARLEGTTFLSLVISAQGIPEDIRVVRSLDRGLDEKAIEAVRQWRFEPGRKEGKPVPVSASIEMNFRLSDVPPAPPVAPLRPAAAIAPVALAPPEPPEAGEAAPAPPAPPVPPSKGVVGGVPGGVRGGVREEMRAAADAERAALEQQRRETVAERIAAAKERAEARRAVQEARATLQADVAKASAKVAADPESQKAMDELKRKVEALTRMEEQKARAEMDKAREEMKIAALENQIAQSEVQRAEREARRAQADADRVRQKFEAEYESKREGPAKEAELKRRQRYVADRFGGETTDRGKTYLHFGPPDEIDSHPSKGVEIWRYKDVSKSKVTLELEFKDGKQVRSSGEAALPGARKP